MSARGLGARVERASAKWSRAPRVAAIQPVAATPQGVLDDDRGDEPQRETNVAIEDMKDGSGEEPHERVYDSGEVLAELTRRDSNGRRDAAVRVCLRQCAGGTFAEVRKWRYSATGTLFPTGAGLTIKRGELGRVIEALGRALALLDAEPLDAPDEEPAPRTARDEQPPAVRASRVRSTCPARPAKWSQSS